MAATLLLQRAVAVALAYFLAGYLGLLVPYLGSQISLIWPASGIAVAALLRWGPGLWPAVWLGAFGVNLVVGGSPTVAAAIAIGNTLAPLAAAWLLGRVEFHPDLDRRRDIPYFFIAGALLPMVLSASGGVLVLHLAGALPADQVARAWLAWWLGDSLGVLLFGPPLFTFRSGRCHLNGLLAADVLAALGLLVASGVILFSRAPPLVTLLLPLLPVVWLAMLRDAWTTSTAVLVFALVAVLGTAHGLGPFATGSPGTSLALLWTYLAGVTLLTLLVSTLAAGYRQVELTLREREARLAEAQRLARLGSWDLDLVDNRLQWSAEIYRIFELDPARFGASYEAFLAAIHPDDREAVNRAYTESVANRTPYEITHRLRMPDGRIKYVHERCETRYDDQGRPLRSIGTVQDITAQHLAEVELARHREILEEQVAVRTRELELARDAAETANRAKSAFLANMSHELRTPLNAILGFAQIMERASDLPEAHRHNLEAINRSGRHLLALINDVLEISRIEAGRTTLRARPFDLADTLATVEEMTRVRAMAKGLRFTVQRAEGLPCCVEGDAERLRQVLLNLLSNAVKFTPEGVVRLDVEPAGADRVRFRVSDSGPGIAEAERQRIFDPFYQTALGAERGEGAGLGLAISREYVRLMDGELKVDSQPGQGSVFTFEARMPAVARARLTAAAPHRVLGLAEGEATRRVLVAEDNADNRDLLRQLLQSAGFAVETARDGREAEALFLSWHPHFIWMDMRMPEVDGYQATRHIRALPGGSAVRIAALTASAFEEDRGAILAAGCDEVVAKPLVEARIFEVMGRLLGIGYRYQAEPATAPSAGTGDGLAGLAGLAPARAAALREAAEALDIEAAHAILAELALEQPALAAELDKLIEAYRFDALIEALDQSAARPDQPAPE
jgi:PAS domain S-box-containing protein